MIALNPRQQAVARRVPRWSLLLLLVAGVSVIAVKVNVNTHAEQMPYASEALGLNALEEALFLSRPVNYRQRLKAWQDHVDYKGFAGAVVETSRGQLLAGAGTFLDASGRQYHDHESSSHEGQVIQELGTREIQIQNQQGKRVSGRIRVFTYATELAP